MTTAGVRERGGKLRGKGGGGREYSVASLLLFLLICWCWGGGKREGENGTGGKKKKRFPYQFLLSPARAGVGREKGGGTGFRRCALPALAGPWGGKKRRGELKRGEEGEPVGREAIRRQGKEPGGGESPDSLYRFPARKEKSRKGRKEDAAWSDTPTATPKKKKQKEGGQKKKREKGRQNAFLHPLPHRRGGRGRKEGLKGRWLNPHIVYGRGGGGEGKKGKGGEKVDPDDFLLSQRRSEGKGGLQKKKERHRPRGYYSTRAHRFCPTKRKEKRGSGKGGGKKLVRTETRAFSIIGRAEGGGKEHPAAEEKRIRGGKKRGGRGPVLAAFPCFSSHVREGKKKKERGEKRKKGGGG